MEVKDKIMYHWHNKDIYGDIWKVGNEFIVDDNFNSYFCNNMKNFNTAVDIEYKGKTYKKSFDSVLKDYLKEENFKTIDEDLVKKIIKDTIVIIGNTNMLHREYMLEKYRLENCSDLPSRYHSIWLSDYDNLQYWKKELDKNKLLKLFKVKVTGNLFRSSDFYIPDNNLTLEQMYNQSHYYWNPSFDNEQAVKESEYLFQGKVKILEKKKI